MSFVFYSWSGPPAVALAAPSTCVTTWMCGDRFGLKLSILSATTHPSKHVRFDVLSYVKYDWDMIHDWDTGVCCRRTSCPCAVLTELYHLVCKTLWNISFVLCLISLHYHAAWTGETGGGILLTNTAPLALPVPPATEVAARTTSATKVYINKSREQWESLRTFLLIVPICDFT